MRKLTTIVLSLVVIVLFVSANAADAIVPEIVKAMPPVGRKDVKIHFYIDGHRRNKDANMRKDTSHAYVRAINALRGVLTDWNNPIESGLRQRSVGKSVEVNTGNAYLLMPNRIAPFSLSKQASESDFGKFGPEVSAWDRDVLVKEILENEKNSENVVVCVISNDPSLSTKHGSFYLEAEKGIMFFMLHAPRESVNAGFFQPYWSVDEWASFLRESMGANANDIANAIVDGYYSLTPAEETGLTDVVCKPDEEKIKLEMIRNLPKKPMWKVSLTHNKSSIPLDRDIFEIQPSNGQNRIVAKIVSPAGVTYSRTWDHEKFIYQSLSDTKFREDLMSVVSKARTEHVTEVDLQELIKYADNPDKPFMKSAIDKLPNLVSRMYAEVCRRERLRGLREKLQYLDASIESLSKQASDDSVAARVDEVRKQLKKLQKGVTDSSPATAIEKAILDADGLQLEIAEIEKIIVTGNIEKGRLLLLAKIEAKREQVKLAGKEENKCNNLKDLDGFASEAKTASAEAAIDRIREEVDMWVPTFTTTVAPKVEPTKPTIALKEEDEQPVKSIDIEPFRVELKATVQEMLDDPNNAEDKIGNRADLDKFMEQLDAAKSQPELEEIENDIKKWKPEPRISVWFLLFVLTVIGAIAFFVKKILSGKTVATIAFQKTGSTDAATKAEAKLNKLLRFDESLDCEVDVRATPKCNETGNLEFELISPNKTVWLLKLGNDKKKQINEIPVSVEEGVYQIFDNEIAMQPIGKVEFESIEVM